MITPHGNHGEFLAGHIAGVVTAVPVNVVTNAGWDDATEAARLTGVVERRRTLPGQTTEALCLVAARRLMANLGWDPAEISTLIYVTQTPGLLVPSSGFELHRELGLKPYCPVVEVNWSCAGYVYGLWLAMKLAVTEQLHERKRALLLVGDTISTELDPHDRATAPIFGDACSATAVENGPLAGLSYFVLGSDGLGASRLMQKPGGKLVMDGGAVFNFTLRIVPGLVADVLDNYSDRGDLPDYLLFHQANRFMLDHLVKKMKLLEGGRFDPEQIPINVEKYGNCSCASIPLLLCDSLGVTGAQGRQLALFGFGAGWAWAGASIDAHGLQCAELLEVAHAAGTLGA